MYLLGDIGNSETKLCFVSEKNKIIKKIIFSTKDINKKKLEKNFNNFKIDYKKIEKILVILSDDELFTSLFYDVFLENLTLHWVYHDNYVHQVVFVFLQY